MLPEFAHAVAASKRAKKLVSDAGRAVIDADQCSRIRGHDAEDRERRAMALGEGLAAMQAAHAATAVASKAMQSAFDQWIRTN